ncbi:MAG: ParA family protein [Thermoguttaceae bacterium]|nr:ParA family protein [Thermoguttaceae bacterium]MBQ6828789.1 ParA family protein [Thermoguttaceae bacterium]
MSSSHSQDTDDRQGSTLAQTLSRKLGELSRHFQELQNDLTATPATRWGVDAALALQTRLTEMQNLTQELYERCVESETRLQNLLRSDESIWFRPTYLSPSRIPKFVPISERPTAPGGRTTRFLSFINLKGGVGKTTLTANVVAAFASGNFCDLDGRSGRPARVLAVDLDFQGTLSQRCVAPDVLRRAYENDLTSSLLLRRPKPPKVALSALAVPFLGCPTAEVVPANDKLDGIDVLRLNEHACRYREPRYYYRLWFHRPEVFASYDYVVFDCPPRLTASSVAALVASDFIFMPTAPESFDVNAVSRTLNWLGVTIEKLRLSARFAGAVLNRTYSEKRLSPPELKNKAKIKLFYEDFCENFNVASPFSPTLETFIPRRSGGNYINGPDGAELPGVSSQYFNALASEIQRRICQ